MTCFDDVKGKLGFGLMRLPKIDEEIDIPQVCEMVDAFLEGGFNYFDTAWMYTGSEEAIGKALVQRHPRSSYVIATKAAAWAAKTQEEARGQFSLSLERTGLEYFDYFLLHNLGSVRTAAFDEFDMWTFAQQLKAEGKVRHVGFSLHDDAAALEEILSAHPEVEFVQLQVNYLDWENPVHQSRACLQVAARHGKPVVVMEPLRGGLLADPPERVAEALHAADPALSCAAWGLQFAASQPGVAVVLSGMSTLAQVEDNVSAMKGFQAMDDTHKAAIQQAQQIFSEYDLVPCTACNYCAKVCPANIGISGALLALNTHTLFDDIRFEWIIAGGARGKEKPSACLQCYACESACPQHIPIVADLARAAQLFNL